MTMDISKLFDNLNILQSINVSLSPDESIRLQHSLIILQSKNKFEAIRFWGKINGLEQDYYITFGFRKDCFKNVKYFYSQNLNDWTILPNPDNVKLIKEASTFCEQMFSGDPGKEIKVENDPIFEEKNGKLVQFPSPTESVKLLEEQRLATVVKMITEEAATMPRGAIYLKSDGNVTFNPFFSGLTKNEAKLLGNYQYYREPRNKYNYNVLKRNHFNYSTDFLDTLDDAVPLHKSFIIDMHKSKDTVFLKSLHWPGMICYHKIKSGQYGFVYMGNGKKDLDVIFM